MYHIPSSLSMFYVVNCIHTLNGTIYTGNNIAQYDLYSLVCAGNCVVCKGGIGDRYCTNCQQRRMIGQYTTQLPVQTKLYRPYCTILLPVCIGPINLRKLT